MHRSQEGNVVFLLLKPSTRTHRDSNLASPISFSAVPSRAWIAPPIRLTNGEEECASTYIDLGSGYSDTDDEVSPPSYELAETGFEVRIPTPMPKQMRLRRSNSCNRFDKRTSSQ